MICDDCAREIRFRRPLRRPSRRRGGVTLWTILMLPILLVLFCFVVEATNIWWTRAQLENALEAAALAAVKDWGDAPGGSTLPARQIGVAYAASNTMNGVPVVISPNHDAGGDVNENAAPCLGDLIFGEVRDEGNQWVFDTNRRPTCGPGAVLLDASEQGSLKTGNNNSWGVAYRKDDQTPPDLLIGTITFVIPGTNNFFFDISTFAVSSNQNDKVNNGGQISQVDVSGFPDPANQITVTSPSTLTKTFTLTFSADATSGDLGFEPCDRFRYGLTVRRGNAEADGDHIGDLGTFALITFSQGGTTISPPVQATFVNTNAKGLGPCSFYGTDAQCGSLIVHPAQIPDLPCPPAQGNNNDGQSYTSAGGVGIGRAFGVRAQATVNVPSLTIGICGLNLPFQVRSEATAIYDCVQRRPRLIRVLSQNFHCGP